MAEPDEPPRLTHLADSVLDGALVDWDTAESRASERRRGLVRQLRLLAAMADAHRSLSATQVGPAPRPPLTLPARWGGLDVLEHVGRGSFGDVYLAWDPRLDRHVALKLIPENTDLDADSPSIISEGRVLARVRHPNVVTIHGADRLDGRVGLWMEFVRGRTLDQLLNERGAFGWQEALLVGIDLCRALSAVHQAGIVHRDIKAQNVLREEGGRLVLMDFGTGRGPTDDGEGTSLSGTPLYLAPELFAGSPATPQSDLYSLGVLIFHLVTRSYPVTGRTVGEVRRAHRDGRRVWLRDQRPDLPEPFIQAIEPALAPDPRARYQSAGAMERALLDAIAGGTTEAAPPAPAAETLHAPGRRRTVMWFGLATAAAVMAAAIVGGLGLRHQPSAGSPARAAVPAAAANLEPTARRVTMPQVALFGRPSPDGRYLAFVDVNMDLAARDLKTGEVRKITNKGASAEGVGSDVAVSPDGRWIAYEWHALDGAGELRVIGEDGSWPRVLLRRDDVSYPMPQQWSADGTEILSVLTLENGTQQLVLVSAATGAVRLVRTFDRRRVLATLSPDSRFVAFDQGFGETGQRDLHVAAVADPESPPWPLAAHPALDAFPMWTRDDRLVFVSDRAGSMGLWSVTMADGQPVGEPELLARDLGRVSSVLGLTDRGELYTSVQNGMIDVFTQAIDLSAGRPTGEPQRISPMVMGTNTSPAWSPDGQQIAYVSLQGMVDLRTLAIRDMRSAQLRELRLPLAFFIAPRWSPDGRTILVRGADRELSEGLFAVDVATGLTTPAVLYPRGVVRSTVFQWSPDARAVWYDNPEARAIVAHDLTTGRERPVIEYGGTSIRRVQQGPGFRISPDGRSVAFTGFTFDNNKAGTVVRIQSLDGDGFEIARAMHPEIVELQDWLPDGAGVLIMKRHRGDDRHELVEVRLNGAGRSLGITSDIRDASLRADGAAIAYTSGTSSHEVWVLENLLTDSSERKGNR